MRRAAVLDHVAGAAVHADAADDREHQVLRRHAGREPVRDLDGQRLRLALQQALRRQHVPDLRRADAEGEGAEGAVRARVAVAADDRLARLRGAELGADDVHDAAPVVLQPDQVEAELGTVELELADLAGRGLERDRLAAEDLRRVGRGRMVHGDQGAVRPPHLQPAAAQHRECLRRRDLVGEVQVDVEHGRRVRRFRAPPRGAPRLSRTGSSRSCRVSCLDQMAVTASSASGLRAMRAAVARIDSMRFTTSRKARTPDSTMSVLTLAPR